MQKLIQRDGMPSAGAWIMLTVEVLTGVAQLAGHLPTERKVTSWIPGQGTCLACGFGPRLERVGER